MCQFAADRLIYSHDVPTEEEPHIDPEGFAHTYHSMGKLEFERGHIVFFGDMRDGTCDSWVLIPGA